MAAKAIERGEFEIGEENANPQALNKAKKLAVEANTIEYKLGELEDANDMLSKRLLWIKTQGIPEALRQAGLSHFTAIDGRSVEVENFVSGTLPKDEKERARAIAKLEEYGGGSLIRTFITIDFAKEDRDDAVKLYNQLRKNNSLNISMDENIHHSQYIAFLKARLESGKKLDAKALGIYVGYTTKFKKPKKKRSKG